MACEHEQQLRESGRSRLLYITEETRKEVEGILKRYERELPRDLSGREILLIALGVRLARLEALPNEARGAGHLVHLPQIRQDTFDLGVLLSRLGGKQRPKINE